jgi:hypothetical protein
VSKRRETISVLKAQGEDALALSVACGTAVVAFGKPGGKVTFDTPNGSFVAVVGPPYKGKFKKEMQGFQPVELYRTDDDGIEMFQGYIWPDKITDFPREYQKERIQALKELKSQGLMPDDPSAGKLSRQDLQRLGNKIRKVVKNLPIAAIKVFDMAADGRLKWNESDESRFPNGTLILLRSKGDMWLGRFKYRGGTMSTGRDLKTPLEAVKDLDGRWTPGQTASVSGAAGGRKAKQRAAWMTKFQDAAVKLGAHPGKLNWDSASYLFLQGTRPEDAAQKIHGSFKKDVIASLLRGNRPDLATAMSQAAKKPSAAGLEFTLWDLTAVVHPDDKAKIQEIKQKGQWLVKGTNDEVPPRYFKKSMDAKKYLEDDMGAVNGGGVWIVSPQGEARVASVVTAAPGFSRTIGAGKFDYEGEEAGVKLVSNPPQVHAHVYYPLANVGKRGKHVEVTSYQLFAPSKKDQREATSAVKSALKAKKGASTQQILTAVRSAFLATERKSVETQAKYPARFHEAVRNRLGGMDPSIPDSSTSPVYSSLRGRDVGVAFDKPSIVITSRNSSAVAGKGNQYHYLTVSWPQAKKVASMAQGLTKLRGLEAVQDALASVGVKYKVHQYADPMWA